MEMNLCYEPNYLDWAGRRLVWIEDDHVEACMDRVQRGEAAGVAVSPYMGYSLSDVSFLRSYPDVEAVVLSDASETDLSALEDLADLRFLSVAGSTQPLDLARYPLLSQAWMEWHDQLRLPEDGGALRELHLHRFRPESHDLSDLPAMPSLEDFAVINSPIRSLEGLGKQKRLIRLELSYCRKLGSLQGLLPLASQLRRLECQRCPSLSEYGTLAQMHSLEALRLNRCAAMPSLKFVKTMMALRDIRFVDTDVLDGDMTPLMAHKELRAVAFTAKHHFSHRPNDVQAHISPGA